MEFIANVFLLIIGLACLCFILGVMCWIADQIPEIPRVQARRNRDTH